MTQARMILRLEIRVFAPQNSWILPYELRYGIVDGGLVFMGHDARSKGAHGTKENANRWVRPLLYEAREIKSFQHNLMSA